MENFLKTKPLKRKYLKNMAMDCGIKVKWHYSNKKIRKMVLKEITSMSRGGARQ